MSTPKPSAPSDKPREFWIDDVDFDLGYHTTMVAEFPHKDTLANSIHVIEYSAYEHENQKRNEAVERCSRMESQRDGWLKVNDALIRDRNEREAFLIKERDALKAQLAEVTRERDEAVEAERELRKIAVGIEGAKTEGYRAALEAIIARKALTEAEGE